MTRRGHLYALFFHILCTTDPSLRASHLLSFSEKNIGHINSFFELEARNIDKEVVKFDRFRGKVTVIANVASYCGESHAVRYSYFTAQRLFPHKQ